MISLRSTLGCLGVTKANVSVLRDFLGFSRAVMPTDPDPGTTATVSLRRAIQGVQGRHVHLNVIRVGFDAIDAADRDEAVDKLDYAVYKTRNVLRQRSLGVGRVLHWVITAAQANGLDDIASESEAEDLWNGWTVQNDGLDVFVVRTISASFVGLAPTIGGTCDKSATDAGMLGGTISRAADGVARTFAHEVGHYLGLPHNHGTGTGCTNCPTTEAGRANLMAQTRCTGTGCGGIGARDSTRLTASQGTTIRGHCSVREGC